MPPANFKNLFFLACFFLSCLLPVHAAFSWQKNRGRNELYFSWDGTAVYAFTDNHNIYFDGPVADIDYAAAGGRFGIGGTNDDQFGFRVLGGYQRLFFADPGIREIKKSYYLADVILEYFFRKKVKKFDPYVFAGPSFVVSSSGVQEHASLGIGFRKFSSDSFSWRFEPVVSTDFDGLRFQLNMGISWHILFRAEQGE